MPTERMWLTPFSLLEEELKLRLRLQQAQVR